MVAGISLLTDREFKMRQGWEIRKLGEVCTKLTDGSHNPPKGVSHSPYVMLSSQNVFNDKVTLDAVRFLQQDDFKREDKRTCVRLNDVLLTIVGTVGRCAVFCDDVPVTLQRSVAVLRPKDILHSRFLMYCLIGKNDELNDVAHGIAQKGIYLKQLAQLSVPVPPLSEQDRIVEELDCLSGIIEKKKQQLRELDALAQSIFYEMFGDPVENDKGWDVKKLGEVATSVNYGTSSPANEGGAFKYLRMNNLTYSGHIDLHDIKTIDVNEAECEKYAVRKGDILFNRTNSKELVGKTALFELDETMIIAGYIIRVRVDETAVLPIYVVRYMNTPYMKSYFANLCKGAVNQANINSKELKDIPLPLPDIALQQDFASKIEAIEKQKELISQSIKETETLFNSRMDYYFN